MSSTTQHHPIVDATIAAVPADLIWRMTLEKYHEMIASGALTENDPIELLEGWLVYKMPKSRRHSIVTRRIYSALQSKLPSGWHVESQEPITTSDSEPEPDLAVIRGEAEDYVAKPPTCGDVAVVIEVADTTLSRDRNLKKRMYAAAAIPQYWIVNLVDGRVEVYSQPSDAASGPDAAQPDYRQRDEYHPGHAAPIILGGRQTAALAVADLLA